MSATYETALRLWRQGEYAQLVASSGREYLALEPQHRVLVAYALATVDALDTATEVAELDRRPPAQLVVRSQAELVLGIVQWRRGQVAAATHHFRTAIYLASESRDVEQLARAHVHALRLAVDSGSYDGAVAALAETRRVVTRAAVPQLTAWLHSNVGVVEAQTGNTDEALRHFDIAAAVLGLAPDVELSYVLAVNRAMAAFIDCDFPEAERRLRMALDAVEKTGSEMRLVEVETNKGYIDLMTGRFADAARVLAGAAGRFTARPAVAASILDNLARLHLAEGRLDECQRVLDQLDATDRGTVSAYHRQRHAMTRTRLLLRRGQPREALSMVEAVTGGEHTHPDPATSTVLHILAAEAATAAGDTAAATRHLSIAGRAGMTGLREARGLYYAGAASVLDSEASGISDSLRARARRLWRDEGVVLLPREVADPRLTAPDADDEGGPRPGTASLLHVVDALATAVDLADRPRFLARELLACIERSAAPLEAEIVVRPRDTPQPASTPTHVALPLGTDGRDSHTFVCRVPEHPRDALLLNAILTVARAALALERARHEDRRRDAIWPSAEVHQGADAVFISEQMQALLAAVNRIAPTTVPVLITGETGTGKEVLARAIHARSNRAQATFLPFSCSGVPKEMLDSQLFGHRKGAFTGAADQFPGVIRSASGGTLFLDEIADIPLEVQPTLLRFLESGEVHPIGESKPITVDVRVIAATNADIEPMVAAGRFRQDLFYRLNIVRLSVAPLRERRVEIPALADHYLRRYSLEYLKSDLRLAEDTMEYLLLYRWPGNVRQLVNEMRRLAALAEAGAVLMPEHLSPEIAASRRTVPASDRTLDATELVVRLDQPLNALIEHVERAAIDYAMRECAGHLDDTAHMLGLSRKGLYLKRQRLGLRPDAESPATPAAVTADPSTH